MSLLGSDEEMDSGLDAVKQLKIERSTTAERVADGLRTLIIHGELSPGSALREAVLGEMLGVSRNTLREAFRLLGREGLIVHKMHHSVEVKRLTEAEVRDIYKTRRILERAAIESAAQEEEGYFAALRQVIDLAQAARAIGDWKVVATQDLLFHQRLVASIGSDHIDGFFANLLAELRLAFAIPQDQESFLTPFLHWNELICDLLSQHDYPRAGEDLDAYLDEAEKLICSILVPAPAT